MIQRIQSIFLFLSFGFLIAMLIFDIAEINLANNITFTFSAFGIDGIEQSSDNQLIIMLPAGILIVVSALLGIVTIFLYKKRILQKRLGVYNIIILFGLMGLLYYLPNYTIEDVVDVSYLLPSTFPLISIILTVLANRGIAKDENLVRSLDRIR